MQWHGIRFERDMTSILTAGVDVDERRRAIPLLRVFLLFEAPIDKLAFFANRVCPQGAPIKETVFSYYDESAIHQGRYV